MQELSAFGAVNGELHRRCAKLIKILNTFNLTKKLNNNKLSDTLLA